MQTIGSKHVFLMQERSICSAEENRLVYKGDLEKEIKTIKGTNVVCISPEIDKVKAGHFYFDLEIIQNFENQSSYETGDNEVEAASIIE